MSWNYRIVDWDDDGFDVREVYYDRDGKIARWSANPRELTGYSPEDIIKHIELMLRSLKAHPTLHYSDLPGTDTISTPRDAGAAKNRPATDQ